MRSSGGVAALTAALLLTSCTADAEQTASPASTTTTPTTTTPNTPPSTTTTTTTTPPAVTTTVPKTTTVVPTTVLTTTIAPAAPAPPSPPVEVALIKAMDAGSITWVPARIVRAESNNTRAEATATQARTTPIAPGATFRTPLGCTPNAADGLRLDGDGLGLVPCTRHDFTNGSFHLPYAPRLTFDGQGRITEVADRYHP
ncbi:hypothetical protein ACFYOT_22665 [Saccharothrix saharensis]|uniref:hypothetical protein n=1 Tax=Saccharothrix saharensis TaxID=571190 RepID=UPI00369C1FBF